MLQTWPHVGLLKKRWWRIWSYLSSGLSPFYTPRGFVLIFHNLYGLLDRRTWCHLRRADDSPLDKLSQLLYPGVFHHSHPFDISQLRLLRKVWRSQSMKMYGDMGSPCRIPRWCFTFPFTEPLTRYEYDTVVMHCMIQFIQVPLKPSLFRTIEMKFHYTRSYALDISVFIVIMHFCLLLISKKRRTL